MLTENSAEVVIVGAGPAGVAAAVSACESGVSVAMVEMGHSAGGQIWRGMAAGHDQKSGRWLRAFERAKVRVFWGSQVVSGSLAARTILVETEAGAFDLRFSKLIIATGARELFLPFPGWTLPGVMGVGALQSFVKSGFAVVGKKIVLGGSGPLLPAVAKYLTQHGGQVLMLAEQAPRNKMARFGFRLAQHPDKLMQAASLGLPLGRGTYRFGCWIAVANGEDRLRSVRLRQGNKTWQEECDLAGIAYGLCPNVELATLLGCRTNQHGVVVDEWQRSSQENVFFAGECTGIGGVDLSLAEGQIAGYAATARPEEARRVFAKRRRAHKFAAALNDTFMLRGELRELPRSETVICRCEDVSLERLKDCDSFREAKVHTRCGMGPCQGRICGPAGCFLFGWESESVRPPVFPARLSSLVHSGRTAEKTSDRK